MARQWTDEQRQAARERMAAVRAAKKAAPQTNTQQTEPYETVTSEDMLEAQGQSQTTTVNTADLQELLRRLETLEQDKQNTQVYNQPLPQTPVSTLQMNAGGRVVGVQQEFTTKLSDYPNPVPRLMEEDEFQRFGLKQNYELTFMVKPVNYESRDGIKHVEPRFELMLNVYLRDDNDELITNPNGTYKMIAYRKGMFFEDKESAEYLAHDMGLDWTNPDVYNQLRYERIKQWLHNVFMPPKPLSDNNSGQNTKIWNNQEFKVIDSIKAVDI